MSIFVGTAGWSIPRAHAGSVEAEGSALERYASMFSLVEINSSFHRSHRMSTWVRWDESVPEDFRFSVKLPKAITHERKFTDCRKLADQFLEETHPLAAKLAVLLIQLPPKLAYDGELAPDFFEYLAARTSTHLVCEPRHHSWFDRAATTFLTDAGIGRVAATLPGLRARNIREERKG